MRKVEVNATIHAAPPAIINAFIDPEKLRAWWQVDRALIVDKPGGLYTLAWGITDKGFGYVSSGLINQYDPESMLVIENLVYMNPEKPLLGPMTLTVKATGSRDGAELYLCQDGYGEGPHWDWYYEAVKHAWPVVIQSLKAYLESPS
jgi:uncharacterized protein YndB with AHSA1/START domain